MHSVVSSGIPRLDTVLGGGFPSSSLNIIAGPPGAGKTILVQQILFHHARTHEKSKALYLGTLSEPTLKTVRYMQQHSFFDPEAFGERVLYQEIGRLASDRSLDQVIEHILGLTTAAEADFLAIDSFKAFHDTTHGQLAFRRFCQALAARLAEISCTTFLLGEYEEHAVGEEPEFAIAATVLYLDAGLAAGGCRRTLHARKLAGQTVQTPPITFAISRAGLSIPGSGSLGHRVQRPRGHAPLTEDENEVLRLIARGLTSREISQRLLLSPYAVKLHRMRIYQKLHLEKRSELVHYALAKGFLP